MLASWGCNRWFSRLWVVQEVILARRTRVIHGRFELSLDHMCLLAILMHTYSWIDTLSHSISAYPGVTDGYSLFAGMEAISMCKAYTGTLSVPDSSTLIRKYPTLFGDRGPESDCWEAFKQQITDLSRVEHRNTMTKEKFHNCAEILAITSSLDCSRSL